MHVNDLRGSIAIVGGSLILHLVKQCDALGNTEQQRMNAINAQMRQWHTDHHTEHRMPELRIQDLRKDHWAVLNGRLVKAASARAMLPFLHNLATTYFPGYGPFNKSVRKVFASLMEIQRTMFTSEMFLTDAVQEDVRSSNWQSLRAWCD